MASAQPAHDPALTHVPPASSNNQQTANGAQPAQNAPQSNVPASLIPGMANEQVMSLLKQIPELFSRGDLKDSAAAEALSNLSQTAFMQQHLPQAHPGQFPPQGIHPHQQPLQHNGIGGEPGPSSHPRGPPNLGQLSAIASALQANAPQAANATEARPPSATQDGSAPQESPSPAADLTSGEGDRASPSQKTSGRRGGRSATMTNDEWARIRKDNHKEVERRRRGNINEGINELGRIVPNGSGEKAKGAILSRAVQYIHHLKENEARNIEKWTLEKLLMDQAMGDLQAQLEEMRRMWEEERVARQRAEAELELLRGHGTAASGTGAAAASTATTNSSAAPAVPASQPAAAGAKENGKREREDGDAASGQAAEGDAPAASSENDDRAKRPRVE
ncbi:hypothetical protein PYCCODRAFT_1437004 [Trametes coccinea BRFM310]|uniref:BHLH domain-containing protein n=1 Tax=Trametes coccinea (strain BRFM310) TaxID=1353009 RepID=A0A1Y2IHL8_TRAC3|nr:hypothetical protein PYCCODRAFT_1437004 [Trametes coccinea BRFM310]